MLNLSIAKDEISNNRKNNPFTKIVTKYEKLIDLIKQKTWQEVLNQTDPQVANDIFLNNLSSNKNSKQN